MCLLLIGGRVSFQKLYFFVQFWDKVCRSCEPGWVCVFVCQIKFFFESQGVYIGVWVFVSVVVWVRLSHINTIRVSSEHELRVK